MAEKAFTTETLEHSRTDDAPPVIETKTIRGSTAYNEALIKEPVSLRNPMAIKLLFCLLLGCFAQTMNGFDGSLFGGLTANQKFLDFFHGTNDGPWAAINSAMYQIGGVSALPFVGPLVDTWGRRWGMFIGAWIIIIGTIVNGLTVLTNGDDGQLKGGRFVLGFGVSIISAAGPIYVVETAHPAWRGIVTAYCNTVSWPNARLTSSLLTRFSLPSSGSPAPSLRVVQSEVR